MVHALLVFTMFEKWTKKFASKATDGVVEGVAETLNDKFDQYGDILKFGLTIAVIAFGGHHLTKQEQKRYSPTPYYYQPPQFYPPRGTGTPIVINNFYQTGRKNEEGKVTQYGYKQDKQPRTNYQKCQNRR